MSDDSQRSGQDREREAGEEASAPDSTTLVDFITRAHRTILFREKSAETTSAAEADRPVVDAFDAEVATISGHLAAIEAVVYPVARRRLPRGHATVAAQLRLVRRIERLMRLLEGRLYGDVFAMSLGTEGMQTELEELVEAYGREELALAHRLDSILKPAQRRALVASLARATQRAPTRPHPYTPHSPGLARLMFWIDGIWDRAFDTMDNRVVPAMRPRRRRAPLSIWDRYFLGSAAFEEPPQRGSPPTSVESPESTEPSPGPSRAVSG